MLKTKIVAPKFLKGDIEKQLLKEEFSLYNSENLTAFPSFCDVHVHLREPGFSYKERIETGTLSAARGGFTDVLSMPNLNPVPDTVENLQVQLDLIKEFAKVNVYPYAAITLGEKGEVLTDIKALSKNAVAFSDDGRGVQDEKMMEDAMLLAKREGKIIAAHCEVNSLLKGGYIHDGEYAKAHGHRGICSESEYAQIERDLNLAKKTGVKYHVCHISTKESVELIREAKKCGVDVTCETGPHYLILSDKDLQENGRFKMNPPLRSEKDKEALIEGIVDGTIDMIATDHAPHSAEEKSRGLEKSAFGVVGLETSFSASYTHLVKTGVITLERLVELMAINPRERFSIKQSGFTVFDLNESYLVDPSEFVSMGKATPFENMNFYARCKLTALGDSTVYKI
ncbi:MAG: dihydroorotase [Clostridia bacterium]|nr:dihydroorotase [Clostridia bacterium]